MKGHNNPPPLEAMGLAIEDMFALVSGSVAAPVTTDEQEAGLDALLDDVRTIAKDAAAMCEAEYRPHKAAGDKVKADWKPLLARCDAAMTAIKDALTPYRNARQKAKDEAARLAREAAAAAEKAAQDALRKSDDIEERFAAEAELERATKLREQANRIDRAPTGLRTHWEAEIVDRRDALNHYLKEQPEMFMALIQELADKDARHEATRRKLPGVVFHERKRAA
jgi:chromosome segregation ATPase